MDQVISYVLGGLLVLGFAVNGLLWKVQKSFRKFPWCWDCDRHMEVKPVSNVLPDAVYRYLDEHRLPTSVVSRYECPRGHYRLWYVPRFGQIEKAFFHKEVM